MRALRWAAQRARHNHADAESGFTLIEAVVALLIATIALMALSFSLIGAVKATSLARDNQQAGDYLNQALEQSRALSYDSLAMRTSDLDVGETGRSPSLSSGWYNPTLDTTSGATREPLALDAAGAVSPHVVTVAGTGALQFKVQKYVTSPTDSTGASYKRLSVVVSWTSGGQAHVRKVSTFIAPTKRGLPLPDFKFTMNGPSAQCRNPGSSLAYAFTVKNNGARDAWKLSTSADGLTWLYYEDVNNNQSYDSGVDTALPTDAVSGLPETGLLDPTMTRRLLAVTQVGSSTSIFTTSFTATSLAVSTYAQVQATTTTVQAAWCAGTPSPTPSPTSSPTATPPAQPSSSCGMLNNSAVANAQGSGTVQRYFLHNGSGTNNTAAQATMPFDKSAPASATMWDYSTDLAADAGRRLRVSDLADWRYQMPAQTKLKGDALVTLYAAGASFASVSSQTFTATLEIVSSNGTTIPIGSASRSDGPFSCSNGFKGLKLLISTSSGGVTVNANDVVRLRVTTSGSSDMQLGYDTTDYQASLDLPIFSGVG